MTTIHFFDDFSSLVQFALDGEPTTPTELTQHTLATKLQGILSDLDDVTAMASRAESVDLVVAEVATLSAILSRVQIIASWVDAKRHGPRLRRVK